MSRFAQYTVNAILYIVLFFLSARLIGTPALNHQQSEAFIDFSLSIGMHDPEELFLYLATLAHLFIAASAFLLIKSLFRAYRK